MTSAARRFAAGAVTALASVAILVALLAHSANQTLVSPGFSGRALSVVRSGPVEALIVDNVTQRVVLDLGAPASVQPLIQSGVRDALSNPQVTREIRTAATLLQSELVSGAANTLTLTLPGVGSTVASRIQPVSPQLAAVVSRIGTITVLSVPIPSAAATPLHDLATAAQQSTLLLVLAVALIALALVVSPDRRRTVRAIAVGAIASGLIAVGLYLLGRGLVVNQFSSPDARTAAGTAWSVYVGGLESAGLVLAAIGAAVAVAATVALIAARGPRRDRYIGV